MIDEAKLQTRMQRIALLVSRLDSLADATVKAQAKELMECVMDLHGEAFARVLERLQGAGPTGESILDSLASDPVVASVLLLYGLHPVDFETRVQRTVDKIRPILRSHGADAEIAGIDGGSVRIRMHGVDTAFTARTVRSLVESELCTAAPDAASVVLLG